MKRREFICGAAGAALVHADQTVPHGRIESIATISRTPEYYHGWPTLAARRNGELLLTYSGGRDAHVCPFGRIELMRSGDGGRHWSWPEVLWDSPIDDRDSGVLETPAGSLLVTTFTSLAYEAVLQKASGWPPEKLARWQAVDLRTTPEQRRGLLDTWMPRSTDGGMTWPAPYRVPVNSPHGPVSLPDGRLLYAGKQLWQPGGKVGVCESRDDGKSWRWLSDIPARPNDSGAQYHELHAVQAANGRIIAHIRNENPQNRGETLQTESVDGGRTWSTPHSIGVWGLSLNVGVLGQNSIGQGSQGAGEAALCTPDGPRLEPGRDRLAHALRRRCPPAGQLGACRSQTSGPPGSPRSDGRGRDERRPDFRGRR